MDRKRTRVKLNEPFVRGLEPPSTEEVAKVYRDSVLVGFGVRISYGGSRSFFLNYVNHRGRERRITIGKWPAWSVVAARERAKQLRRQVDMGGDPLEEKREARGALTFEQLVSEYQQRHITKSGRRLRDGEHRDLEILRREALPHWRHLPAAELRKPDVRKLVELKAEQAPIAANRLLDTLRRLYNFGMRRDLLAVNPCQGLERPAPEKSRDRTLSEAELRTIWDGLENASTRLAQALRLILLTAARPGEIVTCEWSDLDLETAIWTVPAHKAKNGLAHRVPLTQTARNIITAQPRAGRHVFPGKRHGTAVHGAEFARLVRRRAGFGVEDWRPHDLRRTAASHMARIGVPRLVIGRVLNHAEREVTAVYDRHGYDTEKRAALEKWERELLRIVGQPRKPDAVTLTG